MRCRRGWWLPDQVIERARLLLRARGSDEFTRFDGNLSGVPGLPDYASEDRVASPTSLESYATCPHAYFVERLLQVEPLESPEDLLVISPLQVGNLIHNSLDAFVSRLAGSLPEYGEPWSAEQRSLLLAIGADLADRFEAEGLTGHPRLWQRERLRILGDLLVLLEDDDRWRSLSTRRWSRVSCGSGSTGSRRWRSRFRRGGCCCADRRTRSISGGTARST